MGVLKYPQLQREFEQDPQGCQVRLIEHIESGSLKPRDFSFQGLFESLVPGGAEFIRVTSNYRKSGRSI